MGWQPGHSHVLVVLLRFSQPLKRFDDDDAGVAGAVAADNDVPNCLTLLSRIPDTVHALPTKGRWDEKANLSLNLSTSGNRDSGPNAGMGLNVGCIAFVSECMHGSFNNGRS